MIFQWIKDYLILQNRSEDKKEDFINHFAKIGISESLSNSVYHYLQAWMNFKKFPVRPQDNIANIYGIADEDLNDLIIEIAKINHLSVPLNTNYWKTRVISVEDLIQFVYSFSKNQRE